MKHAQVLLIVNPASGAGTSVSRVVRSCVDAFSDIRIVKTAKQGDAVDIAAQSQEPVVLVAGGDGTVNEAINGLMSRKDNPSLGILPLGTSNVLARTFGIPRTLSKALAIVQSGNTRVIDLGKINSRYFVIGAGVGIDAHMYKNVEPLVKRFFGEIAYPIALLKTLMTHTPEQLTVTIRGKKYPCYYALACNVGQFTKRLAFVPKSVVDDGKLDVLLFQNKDVVSQLRYMAGFAVQKHASFSDVLHFTTKKIHVASQKDTIVHCDGEIIGATPVTISCKEHALTLFVKN